MLNPSGSYRPPQSPDFTSYAPAISEEDQGEFNKCVRKIINTADYGIKGAALEFGCTPKQVAQQLSDYLIKRYSLSAPQDSMISTAPKNPDNPDNWRWDLWEERLYTPKGYFVSDEIQTKISLAFLDALKGENLQSCKDVLPLMEVATISTAYDCKDGYDIVRKFCNNLEPITPLIRHCIRKSMFSNEFINNLFEIS
ncbi:hypothetical protein J7438_18510 [Thalassotalea sp. G20_0]|uniref:hypothetical protein n=1 Tax=Thalassotalea sp. G20_0 TaxID=2821093 RepID=UPI001ADAD56B|nr:hypothetical protein [Thalassotalea sp. G20_0]MBO9496058.1 hypothetical protein [Thalassotalea sp. G20_0]